MVLGNRRLLTIWALAAAGVGLVFLFQNFEKPMGAGDESSEVAQVCFGDKAKKAQELWDKIEKSKFGLSNLSHQQLFNGNTEALGELKRSLMPYLLFVANCLHRTKGHPEFRASMEDIIRVLESARTYLKTSQDGFIEWENAKGDEDPELSVPMIFMVSRMIRLVHALPVGLRSDAMQKFVKSYSNVVWQHHFVKWVGAGPLKAEGVADRPFNVGDWGCEDGEYPHAEIVLQKTNRELDEKRPYCNALRPFDLYLISSGGEILAVHESEPEIFGLNASQEKALRNYVNSGVELIRKHLQPIVLKSFIGDQVVGLLPDPGLWKEHPDFRYAGVIEKEFPSRAIASSQGPVSVSISLIQAHDIVPTLTSLYQTKKNLESRVDFPNKETMAALSNQLLYAAFNKNTKLPKFSNFFDGSDGWYQKQDRKPAGIGPSLLSGTVINSGWGIWSHSNADMNLLYESLETMINAKDPKVVSHRNQFYKGALDERALLGFYSSFIPLQ
ncbi:MAG: hypothetical protein IT289_10785 [Oligoflexia bacterium]|nr:hypothetical protein [Oligoflexia bacterium]